MAVNLSDQLTIDVLTRADLNRNETFGPGSTHHHLVSTNPLSRGEGEPAALIARVGGSPVGSVGLISGSVNIQDRPAPWVWGSGLSVPDEHRRTGAGLILILRMQTIHDTIGALGLSHMFRAIYLRLQWVELSMKRYMLLGRTRAVLERYLGAGVCAKALRPITDVAARAHCELVAFWSSIRKRGLRSERADSMSSEFDERLSKSIEPVSCHRSSRWVNWLLSYPGSGIQRLFYVRDSCDREVGYFMITARFREHVSQEGFRNVTLGKVQDWMVFDSEKVDELQLILLAIRELLALDVDALQVCVADDRIGRALRRLGLVQKGELHLIFKASPQSPLADSRYHDVRNWRLRPADGDHFFF